MTIKPDKIFAVVDEAGVAAYTQAILKGFGAGKGILDVTGDIGAQFNYLGTAIAPYDRQSDNTPTDKDGNTYKKLMPIEDVLKILTIPDDRQKLYATDLATAFNGGGGDDAPEFDIRKPLAIASGQSSLGFAVSVLRVASLAKAHDARGATNIYVLEDQCENKVIVLGDQKISPNLERCLREEGLQYLHYTDATAAHQINCFLADGFKARMLNGNDFNYIKIQDYMENLVHALSLHQTTTDDETEPYVVRDGTTVGQFFVDVFKMQKHLSVDPEENATLMLRSTAKPTGAPKR